MCVCVNMCIVSMFIAVKVCVCVCVSLGTIGMNTVNILKENKVPISATYGVSTQCLCVSHP